MALIDLTYFFGPFLIAQKDQPALAETLTDEYIDVYEPEYLQYALGKDLYDAYESNPGDPRFAPLVAELLKSPSPIAGYVFYHYQRDNQILSTGVGDARSDTENSDRTPEVYRMVQAWNIMVQKTRELHGFLYKNRDDFPEYDRCKVNRNLLKMINVFGL